MRNFSVFIRTKYGETDQMSVVYHGNYVGYLEEARTEWLRSLGITYKSMEDMGIILPVIHLSIDYIKPALYDDLIEVTVILKKSPMVKIEFDYEIHNETGDLLVKANTVLAFINKANDKPIRCPDFLLEKL